VVRIYGIHDNPKDTLEGGCSFLGTTLRDFMDRNGIADRELWDDDDRSLWKAKLYPACDTIERAVEAALNVYALAMGEGDLSQWRGAARKSLCAGFNDADPEAIISWNRRMEELVRMDRLAKLIDSGKSAAEAAEVLCAGSLTKIQQEWLEKQVVQADLSQLKDFSRILRLYYYIGKGLGGREGEGLLARCFWLIRQTILRETMDNLTYNDTCRIAVDFHRVQLPLRVNWGGGWSDTPPYCHENGGTVLNAAILLGGSMPVEVTLEKIPEHKIVFDSRDMDVHGEFDAIGPLQKTGDPYDPFALQKACLLACGIIPKEGGDLDAVLTRLGGGFVMRSEVTGVPKGSGLGTSSILSAACVKAVFEFMGIHYAQEDLYSHVLCMEQIMSTGGGWQDQVGGLGGGIKFTTSMPGLNQQLRVRQVEIPEAALQELRQRFALIYTGQRRLARNLLRDVVGRYIGKTPDSLYALNEIQKVAALMRFELERGNIDEFAKLLNYHWELSQKVDAGSTNTLIDQIFRSVEDLIDGRMICGAGGGGFLQVILKKNVTKEMVHNRLKEVFEDNEVDIWNCTLI
jgi:fucokinase